MVKKLKAAATNNPPKRVSAHRKTNSMSNNMNQITRKIKKSNRIPTTSLSMKIGRASMTLIHLLMPKKRRKAQ